nr:putative mitochondrial atp-dependent helicase irc3 [Quercus suber]
MLIRVARVGRPLILSHRTLNGSCRCPPPGLASSEVSRPFGLLKSFSWSARHDISQVRLRPYQEDSIRAVLDYLRKGERRLGISLATGSGKTVIFSHLIDRVPSLKHDATQTLVLAHRRELVEQAARHCSDIYPGKTVDIEMGSQHASGVADITVASVHSIMSGERLLKYDPDRFKLILVDEAHHIVASNYMSILRHFGLTDRKVLPPTALVGVSATFSRLDGVRLSQAIDHIVYHKDYVDMIDDKWLASAIFTTVHSKADLTTVRTASGGDFQTGLLSKAVNNPESNTITVGAWQTKARSRRSTLVFCIDTAHVRDLTATFRQHGVDARYVTGRTEKQVRAERLKAFKAGKFPVLLNCGIYTEGTDIPNVDCVVLARPTKSRNLLVQMIGRGLRLHEGKEDCHIIDMVASLETGIVTTPTLLGLDPTELVNNASINDMKRLREQQQDDKARDEQATATSPASKLALSGTISFVDYESVTDLIEDTSGERHIRAISQFGWVQTDDDHFILSDRSGSFLTLAKDCDGFTVTYTQTLAPELQAKSPYMRPRRVATGATFEDTVHAADTFAATTFVREVILKNARWRMLPASDKQVAYLNKFRAEHEQLQPGSINKGKAGDSITKLKHGAKGRFNRITKSQDKIKAAVRKREESRLKELQSHIKVGPVHDFS